MICTRCGDTQGPFGIAFDGRLVCEPCLSTSVPDSQQKSAVDGYGPFGAGAAGDSRKGKLGTPAARIALALSLLNHREPTEETAQLATRALNGATVEELMAG